MKRILLIITFAAALLSFCACGNTGTGDAGNDSGAASEDAVSSEETAKQTADWAIEYAKVLEDTYMLEDPSSELSDWGYNFLQESYGANYYFDKYTLHDVDGDGTPEMFLFLPSKNAENKAMSVIVTYNGETAQAIGYDVFDQYNEKNHELIVHGLWNGGGSASEDIWQAYVLDNMKLKRTMGIAAITDENGGYEVYNDDEELVDCSKEEYESVYNSHMNGAVDLSDLGSYDLTDPKGFDKYGGAPENFYAGEELETYNNTIEQLKSAVENKKSEGDSLPYDLKDMIYFSEVIESDESAESDEIECYYALWDFDNNGTKEMIVGTYWDGEEGGYGGIHPLGIYTIRDGKPYLYSELEAFQDIIERKWIHSLQGNGIQEGHEHGFYFIIEDGELKEVPEDEVAGGVKGFTWQRII